MLFRSIGGVKRKVLGQFTRGGFYYTWDRLNGQFLHAEPFTNVNWTKGLDGKTGKPVEYDAAQKVQMYGDNKSVRPGRAETGRNVCPNWIGSPTLMPPTYDAQRQVAYIGAAVGCFSEVQEKGHERTDVALGTRREFTPDIKDRKSTRLNSSH